MDEEAESSRRTTFVGEIGNNVNHWELRGQTSGLQYVIESSYAACVLAVRCSRTLGDLASDWLPRPWLNLERALTLYKMKGSGEIVDLCGTMGIASPTAFLYHLPQKTRNQDVH